MAFQSNFYRMTPQIMLEYRTNQYDIINSVTPDIKNPNKYYVYKGLDGGIYYTESPRYTNETGYDRFKNQAIYQKYPDKSRSEYYWLRGNDSNQPSDVSTLLSQTVSNASYSNYVDESKVFDTDVYNKFHYDSINIYFLRGFNLDELDGFEIRVKSNFIHIVNDYGHIYTEEKEFTILDFYLDKNVLTSEMYHYLSTPLYMNSKFYDRYITVEFPSIYSVAIEHEKAVRSRHQYWLSNKSSEWISSRSDIEKFFPYEDYENGEYNEADYNSYNKYPFYLLATDYKGNSYKDYFIANLSSAVIIEFATVSDGNSTLQSYNRGDVNSGVRNNTLPIKKTTITLDPIDEGSINVQSTSEFFNVCIYEDKQNNEIVYYPVYGEPDNAQPLSPQIMTQIENGSIHIIANGFYDLGRSNDEYNSLDYNSEKLYTADSDANIVKWKVYNDLNVGYMYRARVASNNPLDDEFLAYEESFSRIIDYSSGLSDDSEYWKSYFTPRIRNNISGAYCSKICMKYTCRLVNEMMGVEAIRIATMFVNPSDYNNSRIAPNLNVNTYKIVNKIQRTALTQVAQLEIVKEKYIRSYYNMTNLVAKNIGTGANVYTQGKMILQLYRTNNNYGIQLFNINSDNVRIPYDLTGPYKYKLVFTADGASTIKISPNADSSQQNLGIGTLVFYITADQAKTIMNMDAASRHFAIMTDLSNNAAQETTLYEGLVDWMS